MDDRPLPPAVLASDAEREHTIELLRDAVVGGRLTLEEFSDRVGQAQTARTHDELAPLTGDLPSLESPAPDTTPVRHRALCSQLVRRGAWAIPAHSSWRCVCGTIDLDLREARLPGPDVELEVRNVFGTVTVRVPSGVVVDVEGGGLFSSEVIDPPTRHPPTGAPHLRIRLSGAAGTFYLRSSEERPEIGPAADHSG